MRQLCLLFPLEQFVLPSSTVFTSSALVNEGHSAHNSHFCQSELHGGSARSRRPWRDERAIFLRMLLWALPNAAAVDVTDIRALPAARLSWHWCFWALAEDWVGRPKIVNALGHMTLQLGRWSKIRWPESWHARTLG